MASLPAKYPAPSAGNGNMATRIAAVLKDPSTMRYNTAYAAHSGTTAWTLAFLVMALGPLVGAITLLWPKRA